MPAGERFQSILSAELRPGSDLVRTCIITNPDGSETETSTSDPGRALITGDLRGFPFGNFAQLKIPSLRNVRNTAPYFHNNGATTLEDVLAHYAAFFAIATPVLISKMFQRTNRTVIPAGIAGIQKPRMAMAQARPCVLDVGNPCRHDGLAEASC